MELLVLDKFARWLKKSAAWGLAHLPFLSYLLDDSTELLADANCEQWKACDWLVVKYSKESEILDIQ